MYLQQSHHVISSIELPAKLALTMASFNAQTRRQTLINIKLVSDKLVRLVTLGGGKVLFVAALLRTLWGMRGQRFRSQEMGRSETLHLLMMRIETAVGV